MNYAITTYYRRISSGSGCSRSWKRNTRCCKMKEANDTMKAAERKHKQNIEYFENESEKTNKRMDKLGELELKILNDFKDFSRCY